MQFHDYPFQSHFINVGSVNLHYLDEGPATAEPLLMLHGNPTWSYYFRGLIKAFSGQYRAIAPDHIGMGLSDKPGDRDYDYTLARRVTDLEKLLDHLDLQRPITLILHDWGGMIGMALATRRPDRIARIVVLNTSGFTLPFGKHMPWQLKLARLPLIGAMLVRGFNAFSSGAVRDCAMRPMPKEVRTAYLAPYNTWQNRIAVHRFIQDIPLHPGDRAFDLVAETEKSLAMFQGAERIESGGMGVSPVHFLANEHGRDAHATHFSRDPIPILICWGMKDFVFDIHFLNRWIELFPSAEVHRFDEAGHYVLEDAGEQIIPLMRRFLEAHPLGQPT